VQSVNKQLSPEKEVKEKIKTPKSSIDIMKIQKKFLLTSVSNFRKNEGIDKRDTRVRLQSINKKVGKIESE